VGHLSDRDCEFETYDRSFTVTLEQSLDDSVAKNMLSYSKYLDIAVRAAHAGASVLQTYRLSRGTLVIDQKGRNDLVSQVDREAERAIVEILREETPELGLIGEEFGGARGELATWYVDPLDGTTNYLHSFEHYAVSIGLVAHPKAVDAVGETLTCDQPIIGVVYDPSREELFTGLRGVGAWLNGHRIHCSDTQDIADALIATGIPIKNFNYLDHYLAALKGLIVNCRGIRRQGSAALDLAWRAAGRVDAYWEQGIQPWDLAAGTVIAREAGARVIDPYDDSASWPIKGRVLGSTSKIEQQILDIVLPKMANAPDL
jgi:myo-inositol-1(or 4)-monophosphatase